MVKYGVKIEVLLGMYEGTSREFDGNTVDHIGNRKKKTENPHSKSQEEKNRTPRAFSLDA
jgi:hypothetical protein